MKKNRSGKLSLHLETLRHLDRDPHLREIRGGSAASGTPSCLCETLDCPTHLICTLLNTCNCI